MEFFRHCPGCGRRFHIILEGKERIEEYDTSGGPGPITMVRGIGPNPPGHPISTLPYLTEGNPNIFDIREFQYKYKCKHCGHEWTETRLQKADATELKSQDVGIDEEGEID